MITGDERDLLAEVLTQAAEAAAESGDADALDRALDEIGWRDALATDVAAAVSLLFEPQGRAGATSTALDAVLADQLVDQAADGAPVDVAVVLPPVGRTGPPGTTSSAGVDVAGLGTRGLPGATTAWIACVDGSCVAVPVGSLQLRTVEGIDPTLGLVEVEASGLDVEPVPGATAGGWPAAVAVGQLALAHELVGASRAMLEQAREHALERIQFGQPIAQFQAIRHRLAEALVAAEGAESVTTAAWEDGSAFAATAAKAVAGRSARTVARHAQQVLAGIGFTTEHPLHLFVRRVLVLDGLLGDARTLTRTMGAELLATRELPPMLPL